MNPEVLVSKSHFVKFAVIGRSGKLLMKIVQPYKGGWALAEEAAAEDSGGYDAGEGQGLEALDADAAAVEAAEVDDETVESSGAEELGLEDGDTGISEGAETEKKGFDWDAEIARLEGKTKKQEPNLDPPEDLSESASERFQHLANQNRDLSTSNQQLTQQVQDLTHYTNELRNWGQGLQQQMQGQIQTLQDQISGFQQKPPVQSDDPLSQFEQQVLGKAEQGWQKERDDLRAEIEELKQSHQSYQNDLETSRQRQTSARLRQEAMDATRSITLADLPEDTANKLSDIVAAQVMTTQLYHNTTPESAAELQRLIIVKIAKALDEAGSQKLQESMAKSKGAPPVAKGQAGAKGSGAKIPSPEELARMGHHGPDAVLKWSIAEGVILPG